MNFTYFAKKSQKFLVFNKTTLKTMEKRPAALAANIKYWLKQKKIVGLKNGLYILTEKYRQTEDKNAYLEYIASQLITPSYLSAEYILAKYQILSEPIRALTSITTKTSREIINDLGSFRYYSLTPKLFSGYALKYFQGAPVLEANKPKALFDFLYLRFLNRQPITAESLESLRLNWENISLSEFQETKTYLKSINSPRLESLFNIIKSQYYA